MAPWNLWVVLPAGLIFGGLFFYSFLWIEKRKVRLLTVLCLFPILVASFLMPTMPKYLIAVLPFYLLLIGYSLTRVEKSYQRLALILLLALPQFYSLYNYFTLKDYHNSNQIEPWREVSALIKKQFCKGDVILSSNHFVVYRLLNYYLNIVDQIKAPVFDLEERKIDLSKCNPRRIWFVTNIHDDRAFPQGYIEKVRTEIEKEYFLVSEAKYVPYESTIVSKLPIKRHKNGSYRIVVTLYEHRQF